MKIETFDNNTKLKEYFSKKKKIEPQDIEYTYLHGFLAGREAERKSKEIRSKYLRPYRKNAFLLYLKKNAQTAFQWIIC